MSITINIDKAKTIAHDIRRAARAEEFKPYDEVIARRIPGLAEEEAEAARQAIRAKYAVIQADIDSSADVNELKTIVENLNAA